MGNCAKWQKTWEEKPPKNFSQNYRLEPTVDVFLADMLIPYMALAKGKSTSVSRTISEHIDSNIWLMEKILNVKFIIQKVNSLYRIEKSS